MLVWRRSTHRPRVKNTVWTKKNTVTDHPLTRQYHHQHAHMTGSTKKNTIPDHPKTRHDQTCELNSKMSVSIFGNLNIRRMSISRTVSGPEVAAGWCKDALNRLLDGRIMSRSDLLFCLSNRRIGHSSAYSGILAPETPQHFFGLDKDSEGDSPIRILNLWACECDWLAQEVILAHSVSPGCCFDNLVAWRRTMRQYISDMSACKEHADPERVRSLLRQSDDMPVAGWCVAAKSAV